MNLSRLFFVIAAGLVAGAAAAQQPAAKPPPEPPSGRIGFVDHERVRREARMNRLGNLAIEEKYQKLAKEAESGPQELVERRLRALEQEMQIEREDALRQYVDRTNRIIRRIALAENLDIVFLEAAYAAPRIDLTDRVLKELDAES